MSERVRDLPDKIAEKLKAGSEHYRAFVGPPEQYDLMGAMQFRLLVTLGLRETHNVLDFGCGSLRAGRLLIPFLQPGKYFGLEPNRWLIEDAIERQIGQDLVRIKCPHFMYNDDFVPRFGSVRFNFILAQSIFSHAGLDIISKALNAFAKVLSPNGLIAATFSMSEKKSDFLGKGWVYPACVRYQSDTIIHTFKSAHLSVVPIPFFHPRQKWFLGALQSSSLPELSQLRSLRGEVFNVEEFSQSLLNETY